MSIFYTLPQNPVYYDSAEHRAAIAGDWDALCVLVLHIEHLSGKEAMALALKRAK